jgi:hypothetical protein
LKNIVNTNKIIQKQNNCLKTNKYLHYLVHKILNSFKILSKRDTLKALTQFILKIPLKNVLSMQINLNFLKNLRKKLLRTKIILKWKSIESGQFTKIKKNIFILCSSITIVKVMLTKEKIF